MGESRTPRSRAASRPRTATAGFPRWRVTSRWLRGLRDDGLLAGAARQQRQVDDERRPLPFPRADRDPALHPPDELAADVQAQPGSADAPGLLGIDAVNLAEDPLLLAVRDPETLVPHCDPQAAVARLELDLHTPALGRVLDGVVDQVEQHLAEPLLVARDERRRGRRDGLDRNAFFPCETRFDLRHDVAHQAVRVELLIRQPQAAGVDLVREEDVADDPRQPFRLLCDQLEQPGAVLLAEAQIGPQERAGAAVDRGERRAQLVRDRRDEIALELVEGAVLGQVAERIDYF